MVTKAACKSRSRRGKSWSTQQLWHVYATTSESHCSSWLRPSRAATRAPRGKHYSEYIKVLVKFQQAVFCTVVEIPLRTITVNQSASFASSAPAWSFLLLSKACSRASAPLLPPVPDTRGFGVLPASRSRTKYGMRKHFKMRIHCFKIPWQHILKNLCRKKMLTIIMQIKYWTWTTWLFPF